MRLAFVLVIGACTPPPAAMPANKLTVESCDEAMWHAQAASQTRERLADRDVTVVYSCYGVSRVIATVPGALVATTVNDHKLARVVTRETLLFDGPNGSPLPGIIALPGVVVTGSGEWRSVADHFVIEAAGYVPVEATGLSWSAAPATPGKRLGRYAEVLAEPRSDAAHIANIGANEYVYDEIDAGPTGWLHVTASDGDVRVTGWVGPPPPPSPRSQQHVYDFSDDVIEGDLVHPDGADGDLHVPAPPHATGCIRTSPDDTGSIIGLVTGDLAGKPQGDGWLRLELPAPWGHVTGYALAR